jgi:valyl-tRNA synthetase
MKNHSAMFISQEWLETSKGRKMSKSLGNSPDLLDLIDRYGADAVRLEL